jgi:flagellin
VIDTAIKALTENRAELGAMQNRVQSTVNNLGVYDENLSAANSRIRDVDMASETAELTKNNILTTAGVSVLSQANQNNLMALKLLG